MSDSGVRFPAFSLAMWFRIRVPEEADLRPAHDTTHILSQESRRVPHGEVSSHALVLPDAITHQRFNGNLVAVPVAAFKLEAGPNG